MTCHHCGCDGSSGEPGCGCCEGIATMTPVDIANRPGLPALRYRVGTHGRFFASMRARLPQVEVFAPGADGQTPERFRPLRALTTRDPADPAIAMLDAWATVADTLTFYQERIANEGYVRTATERRSLVELSRLVGYAPRPGVSASVFLSYTVDDNQIEPVEIAPGARAQSVPGGPGELPQSFETDEPLWARREWNDLQVRRSRPQRITLGDANAAGTVATMTTLYVAGTDSGMQAGDLVLFEFGKGAAAVHWVRKAVDVQIDFAAGRTAISLQPLHWYVAASLRFLERLVADLAKLEDPSEVARKTHLVAAVVLDNVRLGLNERPPADWVRWIRGDGASSDPAVETLVNAFADAIRTPSPSWLVSAAQARLEALVAALSPISDRDPGTEQTLDLARALLAMSKAGKAPPVATWMEEIAGEIGVEDPEAIMLLDAFEEAILGLYRGQPISPPVGSSPEAFVDALLLPPAPQVANTLQLRRGLSEAFARGADLQPQLLVDFAPRLKGNYYTAWRGTAASSPAPQGAALEGVYLLRGGESLFGAGAAQKPNFGDKGTTFTEWRYADDETATNAFLGRADETFAPGDLVLTQQPTGVAEMPYLRQVRRATAVSTGPRSAYGLSADATEIELAAPAWRIVSGYGEIEQGRLAITALRKTRLHLQKTALTLVEEPILTAVEGQEIELGPLHEALTSGRWVIFEGERADIEGVSGVRSSELLMVAGLTHGADATLPGDRTHTTLRLATPTAYRYKRDTLRIHGNVVPASHGESRREVLGGGDAAVAMQRFELRQPPLTWRPAPTAAGAESTLKVLVNDVEWREVDSLADVGPEARVFVTRTGDDDKTTVIFGNGIDGARPPTGFENIRAEYRNGIGKGGNVRPGQINLLITRPLGVKEVINPLRASGGADREAADLIRENAPRSTIALDRLVSLSDYADFTRMYAGIAKAHATRLSDAGREVVHVTIAGADDIPIDPTSDLHRNLLTALRELGDPGLTVELAMRERIALVLEAKLRLADGHRWEPVVAAVRARLLDRFGFHARALGQPALLCEIVAAIQSVRGVAWADVDRFGGIPETVYDKRIRDGRVIGRRLIAQDEITLEVGRIQTGGADGMQVFGSGDTAAMANAIQTNPGVRRVRRPPERVEAGYAVSEPGAIRPARLAFFAPALADTLILNRIE